MTSSYSYISSEDLSTWLLRTPGTRPSFVVIDVRDDDHVGGHIRSSIHKPFQRLDYIMPEIVQTLVSVENVIFHCALSQQRGPTAARKYIYEKQRLLATERFADGSKETNALRDEESNIDGGKSPAGTIKFTAQRVYVLDGGFVRWQEK